MNVLADLVSSAIGAWLLVSIRIAVTFAWMPAPFGALAPIRFRALLGGLVAIAVLLPRLGGLPVVHLDVLTIALGALGEALVGTVIGLTVRATLVSAEVAGQLAGTMMGLSFATQVDPHFDEQGSPTSQLLGALGILTFLGFQGHHVVLAALSHSVGAIPPGQGTLAIVSPSVFRIGSTLLAQGLRIAAPVMATMTLVQVGSALVSRAAPKVPLLALVFGVSVAAGLATLYVAAPTVAGAMGTVVRDLPARLSHIGGAP